ncbi:hypothetical protein C8J57DRAFT_165306 [Mycena rebaudengoi]|nr:hypothetical protein C8J57DRAFT_165306 [Mycena rebaudengoi]
MAGWAYVHRRERMSLGRRPRCGSGRALSHTPRRFPALLVRHDDLRPTSREATSSSLVPGLRADRSRNHVPVTQVPRIAPRMASPGARVACARPMDLASVAASERRSSRLTTHRCKQSPRALPLARIRVYGCVRGVGTVPGTSSTYSPRLGAKTQPSRGELHLPPPLLAHHEVFRVPHDSHVDVCHPRRAPRASPRLHFCAQSYRCEEERGEAPHRAAASSAPAPCGVDRRVGVPAHGWGERGG